MIRGIGLGNKSRQSIDTNLGSEVFAGDGITNVFELEDPTGQPHQVDLGGQMLRPGTDFTISDNVVTLVGIVPAVGQDVVVYYVVNASVITDPLASVEVDTTSAAIVLNMASKKQRFFTGSDTIDGVRTWSFINQAPTLKSIFAFSLDGAHVQTLPDDVKMNDGGWDDGVKEWTPAGAGDYVAEILRAGDYWQVIIHGPNV